MAKSLGLLAFLALQREGRGKWEERGGEWREMVRKCGEMGGMVTVWLAWGKNSHNMAASGWAQGPGPLDQGPGTIGPGPWDQVRLLGYPTLRLWNRYGPNRYNASM